MQVSVPEPETREAFRERATRAADLADEVGSWTIIRRPQGIELEPEVGHDRMAIFVNDEIRRQLRRRLDADPVVVDPLTDVSMGSVPRRDGVVDPGGTG